MVDDLGYNDLAINNGNTDIHTPNMDSIAKSGMRFTRHYANQVCSPARAAMLTGLHPPRLGFTPNAPGIPAEVETLPERLQSLGYTTWHIGKWHLGDEHRSAWPDQQGFDHWFGFLNQWRLAGKRGPAGVAMSKPRYQNPYLEGDRFQGQNVPGHLEDILTQKTLETLSELSESQEPWFLNLWLYAPHSPVQPAPKFAALYTDTAAGRYRALVHQLDHNIGLIASHLKSLGLDQNTIVVIVSDNGGTNRAIDNNAPFYGRKGTLTEGALRTPLIIRWIDPDLNKRVIKDIVIIEDLYPTLLEALGFTPPGNLDGISLLDSLKGNSPFQQRELFWLHHSVADSYTLLSANGRLRLYQPEPFHKAILPQKLFDLEADPTSNTTTVAPAEKTHLLSAFRQWYADAVTIPTHYALREDGIGQLSGRDLQRTPGQGGFTVGIAIPENFEGHAISQAGVWSLHKSDKRIIIDFGVAEMEAQLPLDRQCYSVVVTGTFAKKIAGIGPPSNLSLHVYLDGKKVDSVSREAELTFEESSTPTMIGNIDHPHSLKAPIMMNAELNQTTPLTLQAFNDQFACENHPS